MILTGQRIVVFGKPRQRGKRICIDHPEFEVIENDEEISIHFRRITPIYPATEGLSQRVLRGMVYRLLHESPDAGWNARADPLVRGNTGRDSRDTFSRQLGCPRRRARASRPRGIFCPADADFLASFHLVRPKRQAHSGPGDLLNKISKGTSFRIDRCAGKGDLGIPARFRLRAFRLTGCYRAMSVGENGGCDCGDASSS